MTKKEQARVRGWCAGWFDLDPARRMPLVQWIMLKLGVTQRKAEKYAAWLEAERAAHASREEQHARYIDCGPQAWDDREGE